MTNAEERYGAQNSSFVISHSFVIGHWSFVIPFQHSAWFGVCVACLLAGGGLSGRTQPAQPGAEGAPLRDEWLDPDTGHRVVRLSRLMPGKWPKRPGKSSDAPRVTSEAWTLDCGRWTGECGRYGSQTARQNC